MASPISDSIDAALPLMDPLDVELLAEVGHSISYASKIVVARLTAYGAYFIIASIALHTIAKRSKKSLRTYLLFAALIVTFLITTLQCGLDIALLQLRIDSLLIHNPELPYLLRVQLFGSQSWFIPAIIVEDIINTGMDIGLLFIINDCLAVWRAVSFYRSRGRQVYLLMLYFLTFTTMVFYVSATILQVQASHTDSISNSYALAVLLITGSSISITVNGIATLLMGYSAYKYNLLRSKGSGASSFSGEKIMVLLAESGFLYGLIQLVRLALSISNNSSVPFYSPLDTADSVFSSSTAVITAMYTPVLIIIIDYGYSMADTVQHSASTNRTRAGHQGDHHQRPNLIDDSNRTVSTMAFGRARRTLDMGSTLREGFLDASSSNVSVSNVTRNSEKKMKLGGTV